MRENLRRPLLFLITVSIGSLIIVVDASVEVIVAGTILAGFLALIITGALDLADLKPSKLRSALRDRPRIREQAKAARSGKTDAPAQKPSLIGRVIPAGIGLSGMLGTLGASVREAIAHARTPDSEKKNRIATIDTMLDRAVDGTVPDQQPISPVPPKTGGGAVDPLASLADLDIDSLEDLDLDGDSSGSGTAFESDQISLLSGEEAAAVSDILKTHQNELDDLDNLDLASGMDEPTAPLPSAAADVPELSDGGMADLSALGEELSALDGLDLDEIEIEGEKPDNEEEDAGEPEQDEEILEEEEPEEEFDMVSFASGGATDDDLITELKSDVKKKKFVEDISLVRELKGVKYNAEDLSTELEDVLDAMKAQ